MSIEAKPSKPKTIPIFILVATTAVLGLWLLRLLASLEDTRKQAEAIQCRNAIRSIYTSIALWANHHDRNSTNFAELKSELGSSPRFLVCPSDKTNSMKQAKGWTDLDLGLVSYELIPTGSTNEASAVSVRCKIHGP